MWAILSVYTLVVSVLQNDWDTFLKEIDTHLIDGVSQSQLSVGDKFSLSSELIDVDTEKTVTVEQGLMSEQATTVIVLLRHFAWLPWRDHLTDIQNRQVNKGETFEVSFFNVIAVFGGLHASPQKNVGYKATCCFVLKNL